MKQVLFALLLLSLPIPALAARDLCEAAARQAATVTGVPLDLLRAITLAETRQDGTAWPWTINHRGQGYWYPTQAEAAAAATEIIRNGGSADLGCFQINSHWHGDAFETPEAMLEPVDNALYAARYLYDLYKETGDWPGAVAAYHSRDVDRGAAYLERVRVMQEGMDHPTNQINLPAVSTRRNRFPLFLAGESASAGSLVPRLSGFSPLVGGP